MNFVPPVLHVRHIYAGDAHVLVKHGRLINILVKAVANALFQSVPLRDRIRADRLQYEIPVLPRQVFGVEHRFELWIELETNMEVAIGFGFRGFNDAGNLYTLFDDLKTILRF